MKTTHYKHSKRWPFLLLIALLIIPFIGNFAVANGILIKSITIKKVKSGSSGGGEDDLICFTEGTDLKARITIQNTGEVQHDNISATALLVDRSGNPVPGFPSSVDTIIPALEPNEEGSIVLRISFEDQTPTSFGRYAFRLNTVSACPGASNLAEVPIMVGCCNEITSVTYEVGVPLVPTYMEADTIIIASEIHHGDTILYNPDKKFEFKATRFVELEPGFLADGRAVLSASIEECAPPGFAKQSAERKETDGEETEDLLQLYPNPFHDILQLDYQLSRGGALRIGLYSLLGQELMRLKDLPFAEAGYYQDRFDLASLPPGTYLVLVHKAGQQVVEKVVKW